MLLRQLKYFISVVETGSFTEAAAHCFISQSAISQQIRTLEQELGVELLHRGNRRFTLTAAGEHFYQKGRLLAEEMDQLCRETQKLAQGSAHQLRIGCLKCYSGPEFQLAVAEFAQQYPEAAVEIINGSHEELYEELRQGRVDTVLSDQRRAFSDEYANEVLAASPCCIEIAEHSPLARQEGLTAQELRQIPCILVTSAGQRENETAYYRDILGLRGEFLYAESLDQARLLAVGGKGYLPVEAASGAQAGAAPLRRIPLLRDGKPVLRNYCAFWRRDNQNPYASLFADILKKQF